MRTLLALVVVVLLMVLGGWLTFRSSSDQTTITVEKEKIKEDTQQAIREGEQVLDSAAERADRRLDDPDGQPDEPDEPNR